MSSKITIGFHAVFELVRKDPNSIERLIVSLDKTSKRLSDLINLATNANVLVLKVSRQELESQVQGVHQGVAAFTHSSLEASPVGLSEHQLLHNVEQNKSELLLVLDSVTDPHNLGACLRTADAAGVKYVVVPKNNSAPLNSTVRKVASGAAATVSVVAVTNLARFLTQLKQKGFWIVGADDKAPKSIFEHDFKGSVALVLGSESSGLRRLTKEKCDFLLSIPMAGELSSLNVSVAAGVTLFEAVRQRSIEPH
jgi:23S rRNA (guanosine2251-2'-O)-methyltransferase|tara:strand:+ start:457 stop:1215 length:759 start_codon:yes stop_codon:yes gene_type:complete